jgi:hypothetical protein
VLSAKRTANSKKSLQSVELAQISSLERQLSRSRRGRCQQTGEQFSVYCGAAYNGGDCRDRSELKWPLLL